MYSSFIDEEVHVGALVIAEGGIESGFEGIGQQKTRLRPGPTTVGRKRYPEL